MNTSEQLVFDAPGPGRWAVDLVHHPAGITNFVGAILPAATTDGFAVGYRRYGMPLAGVDQRVVNGYTYHRAIPIIEAKGRRPPPDWLVRLGPWLHPELRARRLAAVAAVEQRLWLDDLEKWQSKDRPRLREALISGPAELTDLSAGDLAEAIGWSVDLLGEAARHHFRHDGAYLAVMGLLLGREIEAGGDPAAVVNSLVVGTGATRSPDVFRAELADAAECRLFGSLDELRDHSPEARRALDRYLTEFGNRVVHRFDIDARTLVELPSLVLALAASPPDALDEPMAEPSGAADPELWSDAKAMVELRDDTAGYVQWALGMLRGVVREVGRRLVGSTAFRSPEDAFLFTPDEVRKLLLDHAPQLLVSTDQRRRVMERRQRLDAPLVLGDEPDPPSPDLLPTPQRQMTKGLIAYRALHFAPGPEPLRGHGIGDGPVTGRACVIGHDDDNLDRFTPGEILVIPMTTPAHNTIAALATAIVTDTGGLLSHAAIIAREFGIPAVTGTTTATRTIRTGDRLTVDPATSSVQLHETHELLH
ncbi:MAG: PEP-utilizing enzyme [Actinomycetota bacterium]